MGTAGLVASGLFSCSLVVMQLAITSTVRYFHLPHINVGFPPFASLRFLIRLSLDPTFLVDISTQRLAASPSQYHLGCALGPAELSGSWASGGQAIRGNVTAGLASGEAGGDGEWCQGSGAR
jgi:hypothetical protein